ncbi:MAG: RagB/SusD family nutrient uptake outer membrane protein [Gemmatimonadaceae bacterium]
MRHFALLGALSFGLVGCSSDRLNVPNYNNPTTEALAKDANGVQLLATGMLIAERNALAGYNQDIGIFGREVYNYFTTDGRTVSNYLVGLSSPQRLDPGGFANGNWTGRYQNMKNAINLIDVAGKTSLSAQQKSAVTGFAKTLYGLDLMYIIQTRDTIGAPVEIPTTPSVPSPFVSRDEVYKAAFAALDEGKTALLAGGSAFPFTLPAGFTGFNTPTTFLKFNRAISAKLNVARGSLGCGATCYQAALTALNESFITNAASLAELDIGPRHDYSTSAGDVANGMSFAQNNYIYAHAQAVTAAQIQPNGSPDDRVVRKIIALAAPVNPPGNQNTPAAYRFLMYETPSSSAPIIRNEELLLLRAEANWATGNTAAALADLNIVRTISGKLAPLASVPTGAAGLDLIMYEKYMSLLYEGVRWVDMRRWGRLAQLPIDRAGQFVAKVMPIPQAECDARAPTRPKGCEGNL